MLFNVFHIYLDDRLGICREYRYGIINNLGDSIKTQGNPDKLEQWAKNSRSILTEKLAKAQTGIRNRAWIKWLH